MVADSLYTVQSVSCVLESLTEGGGRQTRMILAHQMSTLCCVYLLLLSASVPAPDATAVPIAAVPDATSVPTPPPVPTAAMPAVTDVPAAGDGKLTTVVSRFSTSLNLYFRALVRFYFLCVFME